MIRLEKIYKYKKNYCLLQNIELEINNNDFICIFGEKRESREMLFNFFTAAEKPDAGNILVENVSLNNLQADFIQEYKRKIGIVYPNNLFLEESSVYENLELMIKIANKHYQNNFEEIKKLLSVFGIEEKIAHNLNDLDLESRQLVAISRSLIHKPALMVAESIFKNLSDEKISVLIKYLQKLNEEQKLTIILFSHELINRPGIRAINLMNDGKIRDEISIRI